MRLEEFKRNIVESERSSWNYDDEVGLYVYLEDIRITIQLVRSDDENERFYEDWVESYSDKKAYKQGFDLCFNGNLIEKFYTVAVDGWRMYIPFPDRKDMSINYEKYAIGSIINNFMGDSLDHYLSLGKIMVKED
jgi:hypothetical protein